METTAKEISAWALGAIDALTKMQEYRSARAVHGRLAELSGLSLSLVQQFHYGQRRNLSVETLDKLVQGIKSEARMRERAA